METDQKNRKDLTKVTEKGQGKDGISPEGPPEVEKVTTKEKDKKARKSKLGREVERLREELKKKNQETQETRDKWLRSVAELENYKKRVIKEKEDLGRYGNEKIIKELLPIMDNLERALEYSGQSDNHQAFLEGIDMTRKQLIKTLEKFGVRRVESANKPFDPTHHEAMMQVESTDHQPNVVVQELETGYLLNDRLIRPAKVVVEKSPAVESDTKGE